MFLPYSRVIQPVAPGLRRAAKSILRKETTVRRFALIGALAVMLAAPVLAVGYSDGYGRGGTFGDYDPIIDKYNSSGELFVIRGRCQSACTLFLSIRNACIAPNARFGFHAGRSVMSTQRMLNSYKAALRNHLVAVGALQGQSYTFVSGRDMVTRFGYRACPRRF
jgi:hypothetical protein